MENKTRPRDIKKFLLENVEAHPTDLVSVTMAHFKITRPSVHDHLKQLIKNGRIRKEGTRKATKYFLVNAKTWVFKISSNLEEDQIWADTIRLSTQNLPSNVITILQYGATEMINNVLDHSQGNQLTIHLEEKEDRVFIFIMDDGVGIFDKIAKSKKLADQREAILHLSKGKLTTDPSKHSGEGIFFTSRAFDTFMILSDQLNYIRLNHEQDWFIETRKDSIGKGTCVKMEIAKDSPRVLTDVFAEYVDPETHKFDKTHLFVKLSKFEEEQYISRSQAKRLLAGSDRFKKISLDFQDIKTVGQAFVDEVFRVFKNQHPEIKIDYFNANPDVEFMIKRGIATGSPS